MPIPKEVTDSLMNDKDFLALGDTEQNQMLDRIGAKYGSMPQSENILQRAANAVQQQFVPHTGGNPIMDSAMNGMQTATNSISPMVSPFWSIAHRVKSDLTKDALPNNPIGAGALDIATDPETFAGLGGAGKAVGEGAANILNPSKVYGQKLSLMKGTVDFYPHIMKALDDPVAGNLIKKANVLERFGGTTLGEGGMPSEKLSNLTAQDSQDLVNSLKDEVTKGVKEGTLKPKQLQVGKLFGDLSQAQNDAFEGMKDAKFGYGMGKNTQKIANGAFKKIITGSEIGAGGGLAWSAVKHLFGK